MVRTRSNTAITHLLDSLALTPGSEFATNEDTSGDTGLSLPGGSVKGVFETVVAHRGCYRKGTLEISQMREGFMRTRLNRSSTSPDHEDEDSGQPTYGAANATPTCHAGHHA
jgi:hypothetical protein